MRRYHTAVLILFLLTSSAQAGLQSALTTALTGLQQAETTINVVGNNLSLVSSIQQPVLPSPEGSLFIDTVTSTRGEGFFREGPGFVYDSETGSVTISAPPMLGPADEFGVRQTYSPQTVSIAAEGYLAEAVALPNTIRYLRAEDEYSIYGWGYYPVDDETPSFAVIEDSDYSVSYNSGRLDVSLDNWRDYSGSEVSFSTLLKSDLDAELFESSEIAVLDNSIWPYSRYETGALPEVSFIINYQLHNYFSSRYPIEFGLLAVPRGVGSQASVPEPANIAMAFAYMAMMTTARRARSTVER